jgi:streptogramin lyase
MISRLLTRNFLAILAFTLLGIQASQGQTLAPQLLPYQTSRVAGGGATYTAGQACPSGKVSLDAYGDGCLATEVLLNAPKYVTEDAAGNVYFSDNGNKLIRKVGTDGVISIAAGGGTLAPGASTVNAACPSGTGTSTDFQGDGCPATDLKLLNPTGVAVSPLTGDLVFADVYVSATVPGTATVRGISHQTGLVYNIAGNVSGTATIYGYVVNSATQNINAATASTLDAPYGIHFDAAGNLYISEEYKNAVLVVNTSSNSTTVAGVSIAPGSIAKIAGYRSATYGSYCPNGTSGTTGCSYGSWVSGAAANQSLIDAPYDVTTDAAGNVYFANEYNAAIGQINSSGILTTLAGKQASGTVTNARGTGSALTLGSPFGVASDNLGNIYIPDSVTGWIWRVDAGTQAMWVMAGAGPVCAAAQDANGDGCPANQTVFPTGTLKPSVTAPTYASTAGLSGMFVDANGSLLIANMVGNSIHKMTLNTDFGHIQPTNPVQNVLVHFGVGDGPYGASTYTLTTNPSNFILGQAACTTNSDTTVDCILPVTANPGAEGPFSSNLRIASALGKTSNYTLSGVLTLDQAPSTTTVSLSSNSANPVKPITITATISSAVSSSYNGTVTFFSNGTQIGTPQTVVGNTATLQYTFPVGTYQITAVYSGNLFLFPSTSSPASLSSVNPTFTITPTRGSMTIVQGQTALNSFTITTQGFYTGTVSFSCSGLPANATCNFSPASIAVGTDSYNTVTMNLVTGSTQLASGHTDSQRSMPPLYCFIPFAAGLFFLRRKARLQLTLMVLVGMGMFTLNGCNGGTPVKATPTPTGSYTVTVTATGTPNAVATSTNVVQTSALSLTVNGY